jgi:hypothetical protein
MTDNWAHARWGAVLLGAAVLAPQSSAFSHTGRILKQTRTICTRHAHFFSARARKSLKTAPRRQQLVQLNKTLDLWNKLYSTTAG